MHMGYNKNSKEIFTDFMVEQIENEKIKRCFRFYYEKIVYLQKRI